MEKNIGLVIESLWLLHLQTARRCDQYFQKKNIYEKLRRMYQVHWFADISRKTVFRWKSHQTWTSVTLTNYGKYPEWNISVVN